MAAIQRGARRLRGQTAQGTDRLRGNAAITCGSQTNEPQGVAQALPCAGFLHHGQGQRELGYYWEHVYIKAKSGPNLGGIVQSDTGAAILDSERQKLTHLDFVDKIKLFELLTLPQRGTMRYSALWQADRERIQRMAPIEFIGRYMGGWFDFAIADELHQLAGDTAQGNGLSVLDERQRG